MNDIAATSMLDVAATPKVVNARLRLTQALGRRADSSDPAVRQQAASRLTSELFFKPLLAEMRKFPFGRELMTDGWAGSAFDQQFDERVADAVSTGSRELVNRIATEMNPRAKLGQRQPMPAAGSDRAAWPLAQQTASMRDAQQ